jgi:hypothetical protein
VSGHWGYRDIGGAACSSQALPRGRPGRDFADDRSDGHGGSVVHRHRRVHQALGDRAGSHERRPDTPHDQILREAIEGQGGFVFKTVGDAFCAAFAAASPAVAAALKCSACPAGRAMATLIDLKVRMALHTGACEERDGDYFGPVVNRAARLEATALGGQVILSGTTAELLSRTTCRQA